MRQSVVSNIIVGTRLHVPVVYAYKSSPTKYFFTFTFKVKSY